MAQLLVRDLDDEIVILLKRQAERHGRSAEAEHRAILDAALRSSKEAFVEQARRFVEETKGRRVTDSAELIRQDRDRDGAIP